MSLKMKKNLRNKKLALEQVFKNIPEDIKEDYNLTLLIKNILPNSIKKYINKIEIIRSENKIYFFSSEILILNSKKSFILNLLIKREINFDIDFIEDKKLIKIKKTISKIPTDTITNQKILDQVKKINQKIATS